VSTTSVKGTRRPAVLAVVAVVAVAALVAVAMGRGGGPQVIRLGAAGADMATLESAADDALGMTRLAYVQHRFVLTDGARFAAGEAPAWQLETPSDLRAATRSLAGRLGLGGEVETSPWGDGSLQVGSTDGSGPTLWVGPAGDWSYNDPTWLPEVRCVEPGVERLPVEPDEGIGDGAGSPGSTGSADDPAADDVATADDVVAGESGAAGPTVVDEGEDAPLDVEPCEPPAPPAGVPDEAAARDAAMRLFAELDLTATPRIVEVSADEWSAWVMARLPVGGQDSDLHLSVSFGPDAMVTSASGTLARPVEADRYPTIDADAAVARLTDQNTWMGMPEPLLGDDAATSARPELMDPVPAPVEEVDPDTAVESPAEEGAGEGEVTILPVPEPQGEPEVVTVTLVDAAPTMLLNVDVDGTVWLLPGVRFAADDGGEWQVLTIADEYLDTDTADEPVEPAEPEPGEPEPAPAPEPGTDPGTEPGEAPTEEPPVGPDPGTGSGSEPVEPVEPDTSAAEAVADDVVGMSEDEAVRTIEAAGMVARTVERDGEAFMVTEDYRTDRINLTVAQARVTRTEVG
jgi:hypothetical protein